MKYVLFHSDGVHIGTLQTEEVGEYLVPFIVVDKIPDIMLNVPANKTVMINEKENSVYLAEKPKEIKQKTQAEEIVELRQSNTELRQSIAELTMLIATPAGKDAGTPSATPMPAGQ